MSNKSELIQLDGSVRKKRRWDQPDELLISSGHATPGLLSTPTFGQPSVSLQGIMPTAVLTQTPLMQLQAAAVVQKLNQPKIQEDLVIAREIVINDADPALRYKLTKRQTQEEIQKCTGAVVITRGKYRPPNAVPDDDKPLYLHISSGAHLKETAERVLAVDRAAAMVEDMLKQVTQPMSTCVYVGFDADPSLNIAARICGPNDQYINHIINETGATVVLRGHGSGHLSNSECKEGQQPLHLFLSSNNQKSLEDARLLAENLLDTISKECGATRVSSCKLYGAVPPPQQLLAGVQNTGLAVNSDSSTTGSLAFSTGSLACSVATPVIGISNPLVMSPVITPAFPFGQGAQVGGLLTSSCSQTNRLIYSQPLPPPCTSYSAYAGIYPQASPRVQVSLALKQSTTATSTVTPVVLATGLAHKSSSNTEKRLPHKRKFREAPTALIGIAGSQQGPGPHTPLKCASSAEKKIDAARPCTTLKNLQPPSPCHASTSYPSSSIMLLPLPPPEFRSPTSSLVSRSMLLPKSTSSFSANGVSKDNKSNVPNLPSVPDTLVKLMEYGDDDDDEETDDDENGVIATNPNRLDAAKPFWAV
ncbi:protein RIK-like isoform X1 [Silene latifolia]|uniref:protein RIK-like isoform X1 n=1 Tax=Silene latifolia TaxID=37657 RepID=UPI003D785556